MSGVDALILLLLLLIIGADTVVVVVVVGTVQGELHRLRLSGEFLGLFVLLLLKLLCCC